MILEDRYVNFLIDNKLTQSQFLLLYLLKKGRIDLIKIYKERFPSDNGSMIGRVLTEDLIKRGFLDRIKGKNGNTYKLTNKFESIFADETTVTEDIFGIYPSFFTKENNTVIPLTSMDRNVFGKIYLNKIMYSSEEHREVLKDIQYGKDKGLLNIGIEKFLKSEYWKGIREIRLGDGITSLTNDEFDDF